MTRLLSAATLFALCNSWSGLRADTKSDQDTTANDPAIIAGDAQVETLWEEGGFTEGAAVSPTGKIYFSDFH